MATQAGTDARTILNGFFRQKAKFFFVFLPIVLGALIYIFTATPEYQSTAKLLVKFGQDAMPAVSNQAAPQATSADEHRELVQSNVNILTSRDLAEMLFKTDPVEKVYPKLAQNPPARGTLLDAGVKRFGEDLVIKTENESDIIQVGLFNADPEMARHLLQRILDLFIARQSEIYSNPQTDVLHEQAYAARGKLEDAQKRLYAYKNEQGIVSMDEELTLLLKQRSDMAEELSSRERFYSHYRGVAGAKSRDSDVQAIQTQLGQLDARISATVQRKARYDDLTREIALDEDAYKQYETRAEEAQASENLNQQKITRISLIEQPSLPYKAGRPPKAMILIFSLLLASALGLAACILAESFDASFSLPEQAAAALGLPLLASFPLRTARSANAHFRRQPA